MGRRIVLPVPMTAGTASKPMLGGMGSSQIDYTLSSVADGLDQPRMFKKHKVLPHPRKVGVPVLAVLQDPQRSVPRKYELEAGSLLAQSSGSLTSSPSRRQRSRRSAGGPDPPPTPPAHSRTSSSSHSINRKSPPYTGSPVRSTEDLQDGPPTTPTNQQTPPTPNLTPDRTPPGPTGRFAKARPVVNDRIPSKLTIDSRTESFRTAPENPCSSDDEDGRSTLRPKLSSTKTSQSTVRQVNGEGNVTSQPIGLGLGLETAPGEDITPRTTKEFNVFDGEWAAKDEASPGDVQNEWDFNLGRNVTVKRRRPKANGRSEVVSDMPVSPSNATKALRNMSLQESPVVYPTRRVVSDRFPAQRPSSTSESSINTDQRRSSMMSTKSTASTVVEAILVETPPQRRKTLRHVRKQPVLRESASDLSPPSSTATSGSANGNGARRLPSYQPKPNEVPRESIASTATFNSISSRKARKEVWKSGAIPVVVVPDRRSSIKSSSKTPSLRSTSSRRSRRSQSLGSAPDSKEYVPIFERPRRGRTVSESDRSRLGDPRTIDYPPIIPTRSSSLSAPTSRNPSIQNSRNPSRSGSLTRESLHAHNALQAQQARQALQTAGQIIGRSHEQRLYTDADNISQHQLTNGVPKSSPKAVARQPEVVVQKAPSSQSARSHHSYSTQAGNEPRDSLEEPHHRLSVDRYGDPFFGKRLSVQPTPFSQVSMETTGTSHHAEVSEAMAVSIYPHQNKSVMIVNHSTKPSESSSIDQSKNPEPENPIIKTTDTDGVPCTPPQAFSMADVDSPLRNPRAPPKPPAINFIPATPSGLTPAAEKENMLGNYYEMTEEKPTRGMSLLRRTLSRNRNSEYGPSATRPVGLLTRTFSLSKTVRGAPEAKRPPLRRSRTEDYPDENMLHPYWRPAYSDYSESEDEEDCDDECPRDRTYRYPPVDNRPGPPRRSLSARMKNAFAILPARNDYEDYYYETSTVRGGGPDRRTIRRTPSGNLRVMKFRRSMESISRSFSGENGRPHTAPEHQVGRYDGKGRQPRFLKSLGMVRSGPGSGFSGLLPALGNRMNLVRRVSERRRVKRSDELRRMISGPKEVRDGVGDVIRRNSYREGAVDSRGYRV